jgi:hypothetical protein
MPLPGVCALLLLLLLLLLLVVSWSLSAWGWPVGNGFTTLWYCL